MKTLKHFVKNIQINTYFTNRIFSSDSLEAVDAYFDLFNAYAANPFKNVMNYSIDQVILTEHARVRWNERVSTTVPSSEVEKRIECIFHTGRVELYKNNVGVIDSEIVFTYTQEESKLTITTFYGRISQVSSLGNFNSLNDFNLKESDRINISLPDHTLSTLITLPIPKKTILFQGRFTSYMLDEYQKNGRSLFILFTKTSYGITMRKFYSDNPKIELEHSVRKALLVLSHAVFVRKQIAYQYPDSQIS